MRNNNVFKKLLLFVTTIFVFFAGIAPFERTIRAYDEQYDMGVVEIGVTIAWSSFVSIDDRPESVTFTVHGISDNHQDFNVTTADGYYKCISQADMGDAFAGEDFAVNRVTFPELPGFITPTVDISISDLTDGGKIKSYYVTYEPKDILFTLAKEWDHKDNTDKPESVSIKITNIANESDTRTFTLTASDATDDENVWEKQISGFFKPFAEYKYEETSVPKYTASEPDIAISGTDVINTTKVTFKNTYVPEEFVVKKAWEDDNNKYNKRPSSVKLTLIDPDDLDNPVEVELSTVNDWQVTLPDDCGLKSGVEYTVEEEFPVDYSVSNYTNSVSTSTVDNVTTITVTNEIVTTTKALALKLWDDDHDKNGDRPQPDDIKDALIVYTWMQVAPHIRLIGSLSELEEAGHKVEIITENVEEYIAENDLLQPGKSIDYYGQDAWLIIVDGLEKYYDTSRYTTTHAYKIEEEGKVNNNVLKYYSDISHLLDYGATKLVNGTAQGDLIIEAEKILDGKKLEENEFEFILKDEQDIEIKAKNTADGTVKFEVAHFELDDLTEISYYDATPEQKENIRFWLTAYKYAEGDEGPKERVYVVAGSELIPGDAYNRRRGKTFSETTPEERKEWIDNYQSLTTCMWTDRTKGVTYIELERMQYMFETYPIEYEVYSASYDIFGYAKEMNFTIEEVAGNEEGVTYDDHVANIKVTAYYNGTTELAFGIQMEEDDNVFTNKVTPEEEDDKEDKKDDKKGEKKYYEIPKTGVE